MPKVNIIRSCGHPDRVYVDRANAEATAAQEANRKCYSCQHASDRALVTLIAQRAAEAQGLPELQGTQAQIDWAAQIRHGKLYAMHAVCGTEYVQCQYPNLEVCMQWIAGNRSAAWWIAKQAMGIGDMLQFAAQAVGGGQTA